MPSIRYTIRLKDEHTAVEIAEWVRRKMGHEFSSRDCLMVARALKNGEGWEPPYYSIKHPQTPGPCEFVLTPDPENAWEVREHEQDCLWELARKGAEGDAEAAIAFCKAELNGELHHGAYG